MAAHSGSDSNSARSHSPVGQDDIWLDELRELIHRRSSEATGEQLPRDGDVRRTAPSLLERDFIPRPTSSARAAPSKPAPRRKPVPPPGSKPHSSVPTEAKADTGAPAVAASPPRPHSRPPVVPASATARVPAPSPVSRGRRKTFGPTDLQRVADLGDGSGSFTWNARWPTIRDAVTEDVAVSGGTAGSTPSRGSAKVSFGAAASAIDTVASGTPGPGTPARGAASVSQTRSQAALTEPIGPLPRPMVPLSSSALTEQISPIRPPAPSTQILDGPAVSRAEPVEAGSRRNGPRHRRDQPLTPTPRPVGRKPRKEPLARRVVRTSGELLITLGLVVMLFAGYEVYGKTWQINAEQDRLTQALDQKWDSAGTQTPVADDPIPGEGIARLHIPALDKKWVVVQGVSLEDIKNAPGHYPDSQMPDELGNFAVAGHRTPAIFWDVDKLSGGDTMVLETSTDWYVYRIYSNKIVLPTETEVVEANPDNPGAAPTRKVLTLTTCNPKWDNYERLIVHAEQTGSQPKSQGRPSELGS